MARAALLAGAAATLALAGCGGSGQARHTLDYSRLPMVFERNAGQAPSGVGLLARGEGYTLLLTGRGPVLALARHERAPDRLALGLTGTSSAMRLRPSGPRIGTVNYLQGRDRRRWLRGIPSFAGGRYERAYPGIDVAFHGSGARIEFDFEVAPGADPGRIALAPRGQRAVHIAPDGALVLRLAGGVVRELPPSSHQIVAGHRVGVASRFVRRSDGTIGIRLGRYDHGRALTIDPVLSYGTYLGGASFDIGNGIAVDAAGAAYVTGTTASSGFPTTSGALQTAFAGNQDAFVTKIAPDGKSFVYSTYLGGSGIDIGNDVAVDSTGAAYVTGSTTSANMPTTVGAFQTAYAGGTSDGFVAKLGPTGAALTWSTYLGGSGTDQGSGVAVGSDGSATVAGSTGSANFPTTGGAARTTSGGGSSDAFVTDVQPAGAGLVYSTYLGGSGADSASRVTLDATGAAYVAGRTQSANFPTTAGALQTTLHGSQDAFATKVAPSGNTFPWSTLLGGGSTETGEGIALDDTGAVYIAGTTASSDFPATAGAAQTTYGGGTSDGYVARIAAGGGALSYATFLGGGAGDFSRAIGVDQAHEALVAGQTASTDFPVTTDALQGSYPGGSSAAYLTMLSTSGAGRSFSTFLGGSGGAAALGLAVDATGSAYLTGSTSSTDLPVTSGAAQGANAGSTDAFVAKLVTSAPTPPPTTATQPPPTTSTIPEAPLPGPQIRTGPPQVAWNHVLVNYWLVGSTAAFLDVITPRGRDVTADLRTGKVRGTLVWNRRVRGKIAPPGRYGLVVTSRTPEGGSTSKKLGVTLQVLYAHAPRIHDDAARIRYELIQPAKVTLEVAKGSGPRVVVAAEAGRRGHNDIAWNLRIHGKRVDGGAYQLFVTAKARRRAAVRVLVPAAG